MRVLCSFMVLGGFIVSFQDLQAQANAKPPISAPQELAEKERLATQKRANEVINTIDWLEKMQNMNTDKLEKLERLYQFPLGKSVKKANVTRQDLTHEIQVWYNEQPAQRAKVILSLQ